MPAFVEYGDSFVEFGDFFVEFGEKVKRNLYSTNPYKVCKIIG